MLTGQAEPCFSWPVELFHEPLLLPILAHKVGTSPSEWLNTLLVCRCFRATAIQSPISQLVHKILFSCQLNIALQRGSDTSIVRMINYNNVSTFLVRHCGMRTPQGFCTEGRRITDGQLVYSISPTLQRALCTTPLTSPGLQLWMASNKGEILQLVTEGSVQFTPDGQPIGLDLQMVLPYALGLCQSTDAE